MNQHLIRKKLFLIFEIFFFYFLDFTTASHLPQVSTSNSVLDDVKTLINEIDSVTKARKDVLLTRGSLGKKISSTIAAAAPVGSLITATLDIEFPENINEQAYQKNKAFSCPPPLTISIFKQDMFQEDSDEFKAMKELQKGLQNMTTTFLNHSNAHVVKQQYNTPALDEYFDILVSTKFFETFLQSVFKKHNPYQKRYMKDHCLLINADSPHNSMQKLLRITSCTLPHVNQHQTLNEFSKLFQNMDNLFEYTEDEFIYEISKKAFLSKVAFFNHSTSRHFLKKLKNFHNTVHYNTSLSIKWSTLTYILSAAPSPPKGCAFTEVFIPSDEHRQPLLDFGQQIITSTIKMAIYSSFCINITHENDKLAFNEAIQTYSDLAATIIENSYSAIDSNLKKFWPNDAKTRLEGHITRDLEKSEFQSKAKEIQRDFIQRGFAKYSYQVYITLKESRSDWYHIATVEAQNAIFLQLQNVNICVFRFRRNARFRTALSTKHIDFKKQFRISNIIISYFHFEQDPSMDQLWKKIEEKEGPLLTRATFRHAVLIYTYGLFSCDIINGNATATANYPTVLTIPFHYQFLNCERVYITLFL